mmetsp:Transcript_27429/g.40848  ORF Transcript_27429/g.40848 Transcript_27429/m.40848 type:complete len:366 (-) Transcript_27429:256-1353(-)
MFKISLLHISKCSRSRRMITIRTISFLRETPRPSLLHSKCSSRTLICSSPPFDHSSKLLCNRTPLSLLCSKCRSRMMISIPKRRISFLKRRMNLNPSLLRSRKKVSLLCNKRNSNKLISDHSLHNNSNRLISDRNLLNNNSSSSRTIFSSRTASSPKCSSRAVKISRIRSQCSRSKTIFSNKTNSFNLSNRMTFSHKMISSLQCSSLNSPFNNRTINTSRICSRRSSSNHNSSSRSAVRHSLSTCSRKIFPSSSSSSSSNNNLSRRSSRTVSVWINLPNSSNSNILNSPWNRITISLQFRRFLSKLSLQLNSNNPTLPQLFRSLHVHRRHVVFQRETTNSTQNYTTMIGMTTRMTDARDGNQNTE